MESIFRNRKRLFISGRSRDKGLREIYSTSFRRQSMARVLVEELHGEAEPKIEKRR